MPASLDGRHRDSYVQAVKAGTVTAEWTRHLERAGDDVPNGIVERRSRSIVAVGDSDSAACLGARGRADGWIVMLSGGGDVAAEHCLGGHNVDWFHGVATVRRAQ